MSVACRAPRPPSACAGRAGRLLEHRNRAAPGALALLAAVGGLLAGCGRDEAPARSRAGGSRPTEGLPAGPMGSQPVPLPPGTRPAPPEAGAGPGPGWFTDIAAASGLVFRHDAGKTPDKNLPETMGAGAALVDLDGDGRLDAYLLQGGPLPGTPASDASAARGERRPVNRLFLARPPAADGAPRFEDATAASGAAAHDGYAMGVAVGDPDSDGDLDLYVTNFGPDVLLLNDGHARFTDATAPAGIADDRWTSACLFFDPDEDGDDDLFVTGYVQLDPRHPKFCGEDRPGWRSYCHPDAYPGLPPRYWRNLGGAHFVDGTREAGLAVPAGDPGKGLGAISLDVQGDGHVDLYVANDSVENKLWLGRGDGTFEDATLVSGTGVDEQGRTEAGMGLATGDVDGDLDVDLFVTNFDDESNTLYRNDGDGFFTDVTVDAGLDAPSRLAVGFGTVLEDFDLDGDLDLAVANGHIIDNIELYNDGKRYRQFAQLFENDGHGRFDERTASSGDLGREPLAGRGLYAGDVDGDGDPDLLLTETDGPARLLRNDGPPGGRTGAALRLVGLPAGTRVLLRATDGHERLREFATQTSYFGAGGRELLVGLGDAAVVACHLAPPGSPATDLAFDPPLASCTLALRPTGDGTFTPVVTPLPGPPSR